LLLSEALQKRKELDKDIERLAERLHAVVYLPEDEEPEYAPINVQAELEAAIDEHRRLVVRINQTNNQAIVTVRGASSTVMEAIAQRNGLQRAAKAIQAAAERPDRHRFGLVRNKKDDIKMVPKVDVKALRAAADALAQHAREIDIEIQKQNWTIELL
jgi:ribonuclease PH